jgi:RNA polymerase sigma-70 factor (ECF subfamily)
VFTTSLTLLQAVRDPADQGAWLRFVQLYTPFLLRWARRTGLRESDAEDLIQDVFALLWRKLPDFRYESGGSFRTWLRTVALNKWRERCRRDHGTPCASAADLNGLAAPDEAGAFEEVEYRRHLVGRALELIRPEFSETAWRAFRAHVVAGCSAAEVAAELGVRIGTVYAAKSRVLTRLRRELDGLLD